MSRTDQFIKRLFDVVAAGIGLGLFGWVVIAGALLARIDTGRSGIFRQPRIGRDGRTFRIWKIRTMRDLPGVETTITRADDPRITPLGRFFRRWKIDELPQLVNVLVGDMSFVGPRPDVPDYLGRLRREAPLVLSVRPGVTGPASLKYRCEEQLLAAQASPEEFNEQNVFPDKMRINEAYVYDYRFSRDLAYLWRTVTPRRRGQAVPQWEPAEHVRRAS
jgi:lipopolysaccharide/colanic/teichoic acid biosynthesis glycosyltransferase